MSSPQPAKRRKLNNAANNALTKPFKSPFKTPNLTPAAPKPTVYRPSTHAHTIETRTDPIPSQPSRAPTKSTPLRRHPLTYSTTPKDPAERLLQRQITTLELRLRTIRSEIDTLTQALHLTTTTTDADLEALIAKWRTATQNAAEELFGIANERVCKMGGVQAWREAEKRRREGRNEWAAMDVGIVEGEVDEFGEDGEALEDDEVEWRKKERVRVRRETEEGMDEIAVFGGQEERREKAVWEEEGEEDDFTMDTMLKSMNVDLKLLGWDKVDQRWAS